MKLKIEYSDRLLQLIYSFLFACSLILINSWGHNPDPLGTSRGMIWTQPKVLSLTVIVILNILVILWNLKQTKKVLIIAEAWKKALGLWILYLISGILSTLWSPFPSYSVWGQSVTGDGLAYWVLVAVFVLTNPIVLQLKPNLFRFQLYGLLLAGLILALSIFSQIINWKIDYTITSGQISKLSPYLLPSAIWKTQMPIGFYTNRGHAAFVLAGLLSLSLVSMLNNWLKPILVSALCTILGIALLFTQNRAGMLALVVGVLYLILRAKSQSLLQMRGSRFILRLLPISLFVFIGYGVYRFTTALPLSKIEKLSPLEILEKGVTGRLYLWKTALKGIIERPLFGWGFDGFGIAHLFVIDWGGTLRTYVSQQPVISQIVKLNEYTFQYFGPDNNLYLARTLPHKAHNLILDTTLSIGIIGLLCYFLLLGFCMWNVANAQRYSYVEAVVVVYLAFTFTWYESAQYSHLAWWVLSLGLIPERKIVLISQHTQAFPQQECSDS